MHRYTAVHHQRNGRGEKRRFGTSLANGINSFTDILISLTVMFFIDLCGSIFVSSKYGSTFSQICDFWGFFGRMLEVLFFSESLKKSSYYCVEHYFRNLEAV